MSDGSLKRIIGDEFSAWMNSRGLLLFGLVFAALLAGVAVGSGSGAGGLSEQLFFSMLVQLFHLCLLLVVPMAVLMTSLSLCGQDGMEVEQGSWLSARMIGLFLALVVVLCPGLGMAGIVMALRVDLAGISHYFFLVGLVLLIGLIFISLTGLIAVFVRRRGRAIVLGLLVWLFFLILHDGLVVAGAVSFGDAWRGSLLSWALLGNPMDLAGIVLVMLTGDEGSLGVAGAGLLRQVGGPVMGLLVAGAIFLAWIMVPLGLVTWFLSGRKKR